MPNVVTHGTGGWFSVPALSRYLLGKQDEEGSVTYKVRVILRASGDHRDHRSYLEYDATKVGHEWMLVVFDRDRNLVGQVIRHTRLACDQAMNRIFVAKGLGSYYAIPEGDAHDDDQTAIAA